jgi:heme A synthase
MTSTVTSNAPGPASLRGPFCLASAMLVVTTLTILQGAMTTSTGSGMAFVDWPRSDGQLMPERSYTTLPGFFEHFHRLLGALAGFLSLALVVWLHLARLGSASVRRTAWLALLLIVVQGVIGGVGVLKKLPVVTSVSHGILAQLTLAMFACLAYQLSERHHRTAPLPNVAPGTGRRITVVAVVMLVLQAVIGGIARHSNNQHALWTHAGNSLVVFLVVVIATAFAVGRLGEAPGIKSVARQLTTLLIVQLALGFLALLVRNDAGKTPENVANLGTAALISAHVLIGALLTVLAAMLAAHVFRATRRPDAPQVVA